MNDFVRCNKLTGVYWLQGTVDALKIKIRLKPPDDIISLPTFEEYTREPGNISLHQDIEEFSFNWQQKRFSQWEVQRYRDIHNCLTEHELSYHELVNSEEILPSRVFSHVHQDRFLPLPQAKRKDVSLLSSCLEYLRLDGALGRIGGAFKKSASEKHLFTSQDDVDEEEEQWTAMHVVFDNSNYNEEGVIVKQEATLLSVYHNSVQNLVILSPDVNHLESNPYVVEACGDLPRHRYAVGVELGAQGASGELDTLLLNIHKKWEKKHKQSVKFSLPPLRVSRWFLALEVEAARGFPADNLYIEYHLKVPESAQCRDSRQGRTQMSGARRAAGTRVFHFGHLLELCLEAEAGTEVGPVHIYLEAISTDHWRRHRTEGYCHLALPLAPGGRVRDLRCVRPEERGTCGRRFFLGGCHLVPQLEVFSAPQLQGGEYTYTEAGSVSLRTSVVAQHAACAGVPQGEGAGRGAEALLRSAEAALAHYRRARARLALAAAGAAATRH